MTQKKGLTARRIGINSWGALLDISNQLNDLRKHAPPSHTVFLYRGQADQKWGLTSSLLRRARGLTAEQTLALERLALERFTAEAHQHMPAPALPGDGALLDWWILMQHYGVPTRLLDWTTSLFVAAYFAVVDEPTVSGVIWIVSATELEDYVVKHFPPDLSDVNVIGEDAERLLDPDAPSTLYLGGPRVTTDRMGAQQTAFIFSANVR